MPCNNSDIMNNMITERAAVEALMSINIAAKNHASYSWLKDYEAYAIIKAIRAGRVPGVYCGNEGIKLAGDLSKSTAEIADLKARLEKAEREKLESEELHRQQKINAWKERDAAIARAEKAEATLIKSLDRNDTLQERVVGLEREAEIDDEAYRGVLKKYDEAISERDDALVRIARLVGLLKDIREVYRDHDGPTWDRIDAEIGEKP